jgi:hypothetical protein
MTNKLFLLRIILDIYPFSSSIGDSLRHWICKALLFSPSPQRCGASLVFDILVIHLGVSGVFSQPRVVCGIVFVALGTGRWASDGRYFGTAYQRLHEWFPVYKRWVRSGFISGQTGLRYAALLSDETARQHNDRDLILPCPHNYHRDDAVKVP